MFDFNISRMNVLDFSCFKLLSLLKSTPSRLVIIIMFLQTWEKRNCIEFNPSKTLQLFVVCGEMKKAEVTLENCFKRSEVFV